MASYHYIFVGILLPLFRLCCAQQSQALLPKPNGTYAVGLHITEMIDEARLAPFAPDAEPRKLEVSIFYPVNNSSSITAVEDMPPDTARFEDLYQTIEFNLTAPNGTFERLALQLASNGTHIAAPAAGWFWPVLIFGVAEGTTRLYYNTIASQVCSNGYVVVTYDTAYDTDIVQYSDGSFAFFNTSVAGTEAEAVLDVTDRAQDASFIIDQLSNATSVAALIPGCRHCLNVTHVGMFGHSLGGSAAATVMLNDTRVAGGLDFDGALWGDVIDKGLDRPFMLMTTEGQTRASQNQPNNPDASWYAIWHELTGPKFDFVLSNSLHYTYSDIPIMLETLGIKPNSTTMAALQITGMEGTRALHIVTSYTVAFFDFVLHGKSSELLQGPSPLFPEITIDAGNSTGNSTGDSVAASSSSTASSASTLASGTGSATSGAKRHAEAALGVGTLVVAAGISLTILS